ncbi:MAG: Gfo/Idh/MocA family oxidoreductase [Angelakisella sp.]
MGVIGLGARGASILSMVLIPMEGFTVTAVCDGYEDRRTAAAKLLTDAGLPAPKQFADYHKLLDSGCVDSVYIATSWQTHSEIAIDAMLAGVAVASEIGGAFTEHECWKLVETYEATKTPFMPMENCCFGQKELMVTRMVREGLFGDVTHCSGGYLHDLRDEIGFGREKRHYRLDNYKNRNCENYPTHELGPIAVLLRLGHGNRMISLTSTSSRAAGMSAYLAANKPDDTALAGQRWVQGDVVNTTIKCAHGETIALTLDTTLPRYYSRGFSVHGTKALYTEDNNSLFLDGVHNQFDFNWAPKWNNFEEYRKQYEHPIWQKFISEGIQGGHDGMDWLEFQAFRDCWQNKEKMPIDVYDMASWMMVSLLSEQSIAMGSSPVAFPDFTNGGWLTNYDKGYFD